MHMKIEIIKQIWNVLWKPSCLQLMDAQTDGQVESGVPYTNFIGQVVKIEIIHKNHGEFPWFIFKLRWTFYKQATKRLSALLDDHQYLLVSAHNSWSGESNPENTQSCQ